MKTDAEPRSGQAPNDRSGNRGDLGTALWRGLGIVAFLAVIGAAVLMESSLGTFLDPASLLIVALGTATLLLTTYGSTGFAHAFATLFGGFSRRGTPAEAASFFRTGAAFALACGFLGTLIGLVIILHRLDDASSLGPAMAVALLTQFYGVLLAIGLYCAATSITRRESAATTANDITQGTLPVAGAVTAVGTLTLLLAFFILWLALPTPGLA